MTLVLEPLDHLRLDEPKTDQRGPGLSVVAAIFDARSKISSPEIIALSQTVDLSFLDAELSSRTVEVRRRKGPRTFHDEVVSHERVANQPRKVMAYRRLGRLRRAKPRPIVGNS